jgi:hypothetical protein
MRSRINGLRNVATWGALGDLFGVDPALSLSAGYIMFHL